jgi:hypothetical protein
MMFSDLLNYWISPKGEAFKVGYMGHATWADEYLLENNLYEHMQEKYPYEDLTQRLEKEGWVRIIQWATHPKPFILPEKDRYTKHITRALIDILIDNNIEIEDYMGLGD